MAWVAFLGILIPLGIGLWFMAPVFLPIYMWTKVDLKAISAAKGIPETQLTTEFKLKVRYNPRDGKESDPMPWQIIEMEPTWASLHPNDSDNDENKTLVRCTFISGNDGKSPSKAFINSWKDWYWTCKAIRLPPGSLGFNTKRPVVIYDSTTMTKMDFTNTDTTHRDILMGSWDSDDKVRDWPDRDDGFVWSGAQ